MSKDQAKQEFTNLMKEMKQYEEAIALMAWDLRTKAPKKGIEQRSEVIGMFAQKVHQLSTSDEMKRLLEELREETDDPILKRSVELAKKDFEKNEKIPDQEYKEFVMLRSKAESVWEEAKNTNNFSLFEPYLEKIVEFNRRFANYWGYEDHIYNALLDQYEPGVTVRILDEVFPPVREKLTELVQKIQQSDVAIDSSKILLPFPKQQQEKFSLEILKAMGYDFSSGRLDETVHPFAISLNPFDVRVTTKYDEKDFRTAVFGTIHEGGHALYEQNIDQSLINTPMATGTSMGIHESQSLFWENFVARTNAFWEKNYDLFKSIAPSDFQEIELPEFYKMINEVKPSFIRIEADELTYCLHIMIRYEIEKALISGEVQVKDVPELWNSKMEEYLGIRPATDSEGVLQDIHWAGGDFGYFPSYALGYMYAAQFRDKMKEEHHVEELIRQGKLSVIKKWLTENIHQYGKMKEPLEILKDVTGESLNPDHLMNYLEDKYSKIYKF